MGAEREEGHGLPSGVVTFLLTDVARSTDLWTSGSPDAARRMARQAEVIAAAVEAHGGIRPIEQGEGDSVVAVFERASDALLAALDAQLALARDFGDRDPVRVRMAVHTGEAEFRDEHSYGGAAIIRCARLRDLAVGGQVLVSAATAEVVADKLPDGAVLVPVGEVPLRGLTRPERVHQLTHEALVAPLAELSRRVARLDAWPTALIGRRREREELAALVKEARLVTVAGTGGAGKTRLAHAVAAGLGGRFDDVVWVELARVAAAADVSAAVVQACGAREVVGVDSVEVLARFLHDKEILLVLDNCEHLLEGCALLVEHILRRTPRTRILTTSREPLGSSGEVVWRIPSLGIPPHRPIDGDSLLCCESVELFIDRARAADPTFVLDDASAADVASICRRLDGLPLAIELAAARLRSMPLRTITEGLNDRFRLLTGGAPGSLPRQQAMLASVEWSYGWAGPKEQQLLRWLAVFVSPFMIEAAEAVAAEGGLDRFEVFEFMSRLVDRSLIQRDGDRYGLLETIRRFALAEAEREGELEAVRDAHLSWFRTRAVQWAVDRDIVTAGVLSEIAREAPDVVGALDWSLQRGGEPALELLWPLGRYWLAEGCFTEAIRVSNDVLQRFETGSVGWFAALAPVGEALILAGDRAPIEAALEILNRTPGVVDGATEAHVRLASTTPGVVGSMIEDHVRLAATTVPLWQRDAARLDTIRSVMERGHRSGNRPLEYGAAAALAYACAAGGTLDEAGRLCDWLTRRLAVDADLQSTLTVAQGYAALHRCQFDAAWNTVLPATRRRPPDLRAALVAGLVGAYTADLEKLALGREALGWIGPTGAFSFWQDVLDVFRTLLESGFGGLSPASMERFTGDRPSPFMKRLYVQLLISRDHADAAAAVADELAPLVEHADYRQPYGVACLQLMAADVAVARNNDRYAEDCVQHVLNAATHLPLVAVDAVELLAVLFARRNRSVDAARLVGATEAFRDATGFRFRYPLRSDQLDAVGPMLDPGDIRSGAAMSLGEVLSLVARTRGKRGRPRLGWDSLTPTEVRVVDLVAGGLSNAEIADKLFIGVATVKTHLVHVYEKLGVRSRAELAAVTARREPQC